MAAKKTTKKKKEEGSGHLFMVKILEKLVDFFKGLLSVNLLDFCIKWASKFGHFGLIVAAGLGFLFAIIFAVRVNSFFAFLYGIAWIIVVFVVQYTAHKFSNAGDGLIKNNPTTLASKAFLDCFGFLALIGGVVVLIIYIIQAIQVGDVIPFLVGLGLFIFLEFLALIAFNPKTATVEIVQEGSAGQEALGIVTFFLKAILRLVPIIFGVGIVVYTIMLFIDFIGVFGDNVGFAWQRGNWTASQILIFGLLPFLSYIFFVLYYLVIDVIRAILAVPPKLDELKKSK
jgi:hypothetical protein